MLTALQRLLPMAEKVIDRRSSLPILKDICIDGGLARVTDLETMLVMPVPDARQYTIPVSLLKKVLKTKPSSLVVNTIKDDKIAIRYGDHTVTYTGKSADDFPLIPSGKFKTIGEWTRGIFQGLAAQSPYCSTDVLKPALMGVHVSQDKGTITSSATDGHILRRQNGLDVGKAKPLSGIIPTKPLLLLAKVARGNTRIGLSDTHLSFSLPGEVTMYVRLIDETYPDVASVLPEEFAGDVLFDRDKVLAIIKAARPFVNTSTHLSVLTLGNGNSSINVDDLEEGVSWEAPLPIPTVSGPEIRIGFDLALLERALASQQTPLVRLKYNTPTSAAILKEVGEDWDSGAITLLMPIRLTDKEEADEPECSDRPSAEA